MHKGPGEGDDPHQAEDDGEGGEALGEDVTAPGACAFSVVEVH